MTSWQESGLNLSAYRAFKDCFRKLIGDARQLAESLGFSGLVQVCGDLDRRLIEERFFISVLGEIKRGKSTLINALLGAEILPKAALICTASLCIIRFGPKPRAIVFFREGETMEVPPSDLKTIATKKNHDADKIRHIEIEYPLPLLQDGIVIVDTPGVNDTDEVRRRLTEEFIPRSDGVLFVLNAGQPFSDSEMRFLIGGVLKFHIRKLWFVVNALDRLENNDQREEALAYCQEQLDEVLPNARIHGVSAKLFLDGIREQQASKRAESGISDFLESLTRDLIESRWEGLIHVPIGMFGSYLAELNRGIEWELSLIEKSSGQRSEMLADLEKEAKDLETEKNRMLRRFQSEAESHVYEIAQASKGPAFDGLVQAICLSLQMDAPDERKERELGHLFRERLQSYVQQLLDDLHGRLAPVARRLSADMAGRVARLDSRAEQAKPRDGTGFHCGYSVKNLPELELTPPNIISRFAPIFSLGFLLTGNLALAAATLAPSFWSRLSSDSAPGVIQDFRERLAQAGNKAKDLFMQQKTAIAETFSEQLLKGFSPLMRLVEDATDRARKVAGEADSMRSERKKNLKSAQVSVSKLKEAFSKLSKEFEE